MQINNNKAIKEIVNYTIATYKKIKVNPGKCRYNYMCHSNAVHEAKKKKHKKIAMVIYIDEGYPIIHFINFKNKKFKDNTLGQWTKNNEYYFVRWIKNDEMWEVHTIFRAFKKEIRKKLNWWTKLTSDYNG